MNVSEPDVDRSPSDVGRRSEATVDCYVDVRLQGRVELGVGHVVAHLDLGLSSLGLDSWAFSHVERRHGGLRVRGIGMRAFVVELHLDRAGRGRHDDLHHVAADEPEFRALMQGHPPHDDLGLGDAEAAAHQKNRPGGAFLDRLAIPGQQRWAEASGVRAENLRAEQVPFVGQINPGILGWQEGLQLPDALVQDDEVGRAILARVQARATAPLAC